jgi:NAD dependent epimerase/dehydratase
MTSSNIGKTALVTGAGGFIGSHLVELLVNKGFNVKAFVHYNSKGDSGWLSELPKDIQGSFEIISGDLTDTEFVNKSAKSSDVIFHLGALIAIPYSYLAPRSYINTNVYGTLNICEAARNHEARLLHMSTSEVYGTPETTPISENHALKPQSPYAASKVAADQVALSFFRSFGTRVSVIRPFNTYGPRQSQRAIIPTLLSQVLSGKNEIKVGSLSPKRDFTYVEDTARGLLAAESTDGIDGETIQLGTGETISIGDLITLISKVTGKDFDVNQDSTRIRPNKSEVEVLLSDPSKALKLIGWAPQVSLENGLKKTIKWMEENLHKLNDPSKYAI